MTTLDLPNSKGIGGVLMPGKEDREVKTHLKHLALEGKAALTIYHRQRALARLAAALPVPLLDADEGMLYDWRASLQVTDAAAAGYISHVKEFYRWAVRAGYLLASPAEELPVPKVRRRQPRPITEADLNRAIETANARVRIWLILAAWAGFRACEISSLRVEDLRLNSREPVVIVRGKGDKERIVHLCDFAVAELRAAKLPAKGLAWRKADGGQLRAWWVSKLCNEHLHQEGITSTLHKLRARFATALADAGTPILVVRDELGHASVATTEIYTLANNKAAKAAVNKLPAPKPRRSRTIPAVVTIVMLSGTGAPVAACGHPAHRPAAVRTVHAQRNLRRAS